MRTSEYGKWMIRYVCTFFSAHMPDVVAKSLGKTLVHVSRRVQMELVERNRQDTSVLDSPLPPRPRLLACETAKERLSSP